MLNRIKNNSSEGIKNHPDVIGVAELGVKQKRHYSLFKILNSGFTLIEILIVISILGIISSVALGNFRSSQLKGRDLRRKEDLRHLKAAVELYYNDYGRYPAADAGGRLLGCPTSSSAPCEWGTGAFTDGKTLYEQKVPSDPSRALTYFYKASSDFSKYQIFARLENTKDPMIISGLNVDCGVVCNYGVSSPNVQVTDSI